VSRPLSGAISSLNSPTAAHRLCPGKGRAVPPRGHCLQQLEGSFISKGTRVWIAPQPIQQQACWAKHLDSAWATPTDFAKLPISAPSMPPSCLGSVVSKGARQPTCCHQCSHVMAVTISLHNHRRMMHIPSRGEQTVFNLIFIQPIYSHNL
jgi:hypothetical protein